jgi:DNA-binding beta-propeller fold protein YncE
VVSRSTNQIIQNNIAVGSSPIAAAFDSKDDVMYVANFHSDTVSAISGSNYAVNTISVSGPNGIAYDSGNRYLYVGDGNTNQVFRYFSRPVTTSSPSSSSASSISSSTSTTTTTTSHQTTTTSGPAVSTIASNAPLSAGIGVVIAAVAAATVLLMRRRRLTAGGIDPPPPAPQ